MGQMVLGGAAAGGLGGPRLQETVVGQVVVMNGVEYVDKQVRRTSTQSTPL